jgi:hypothetical protein
VASVAPTEDTDPLELASRIAFFHSRLLLFLFFQFNRKPLKETNQNKKAKAKAKAEAKGRLVTQQ